MVDARILKAFARQGGVHSVTDWCGTGGRPGAGVSLLREQLLARAPGTRLVFPRKHGSPWSHSAFRRLVWLPMIRDATKAWEREHPNEPVPFAGLTTHDLRRTAITLMCEAEMAAELAAERVGHGDGGALLPGSWTASDRHGGYRAPCGRNVDGAPCPPRRKAARAERLREWAVLGSKQAAGVFTRGN